MVVVRLARAKRPLCVFWPDALFFPILPSCAWRPRRNPRGSSNTQRAEWPLWQWPMSCQGHRVPIAQKVTSSPRLKMGKTAYALPYPQSYDNKSATRYAVSQKGRPQSTHDPLKSESCGFYEYTKNKELIPRSILVRMQLHFLRLFNFNMIFDIEIHFLMILWNIMKFFDSMVRNFCYS